MRRIGKAPAAAPAPRMTEEARAEMRDRANNLQPSPRAAQIEAWWQTRDAHEDLLRVMEGLGGPSEDDLAKAVTEGLKDSDVIKDGVEAALETVLAESAKVADAIKEMVGAEIKGAFVQLPHSGLGEELRANQAEGLRRSFKEDPDVRGELASLVKAAVTDAFGTERNTSLRESLQELIRAEIHAALSSFSPAPAPATKTAEKEPDYTPRAAHSRPQLKSARPVAWAIRPKLHGLNHKEFWTITLNAQLQVIGMHQISKGGLSQCSVTAREALRPALLDQAPCVVFVHNHPSGDVRPSQADLRLFLLLEEGARTLGVRCVDHLILSDGTFYSHTEGEAAFEAGALPTSPAAPAPMEDR